MRSYRDQADVSLSQAMPAASEPPEAEEHGTHPPSQPSQGASPGLQAPEPGEN